MCVNHCGKSIRDLVVPIRCLQRKERSLLALKSQFSVADPFELRSHFILVMLMLISRLF